MLPASFAADPDRVMRFTREAQTLAALNHPHIAHIYGVEESGARRALVMELVEGETLAERLARGALPVDEALPIARQVADALEVAHEAAIVHRDLKPANVKLRPDGTVKVLDFGLAKAIEPATGSVGDSAANSPTLTSPALTRAGIVLGTASYMSPEQARGKPVDRRADIWAFGCVLFEMLTGRVLFAGETVTDTLARVIEREPDLSALPATTPPDVRTLLARCLARDPRQRLRDIGEARIALERPAAPASIEGRGSSRPGRGTLAAVVIAAAAVAAATTAWLMRAAGPAPARGERRFTLAAPGDAAPAGAIIAPDGGAILVIADGKLWLQRLDDFAATEVPGSEDARAPFWSADGATFGFEVKGQLWRVSRDGGAPARIGAVPEFGFSSAVAWLPDGRLVFTTGGSGLLQMPVTGGEPTLMFPLDATKELDVHDVSALPDGRALLYVVHAAKGPWTIEMFTPATSSRRTLYTAANGTLIGTPFYSPTGHIVYDQQGALWALPPSIRDDPPTGEPFLVLPDARQPTVAADGTLLAVAGGLGADAGLALIDRSGKVVRTIVDPRGMLVEPRLSPDGRLAIVARGALNDSDLWIYDLERGSERRLTFEDGGDTSPVWSPDGRHIVYRCGRSICARRSDGTGSRVELLDGPGSTPALSPDGTLLAFARETQPGDTEIFVVELDPGGLERKVTAAPRLLVSAPRLQVSPVISPDGRHVAYTSMEGGRMSTYVSQFPSGNGKWTVPFDRTNVSPRWSATGHRLIVMDDLGRIVEFPVDRSHGVDFGAPLEPIPSRATYGGGYDRAAGDAQFLVPVTRAGLAGAGRLLVVQDWQPQRR
jgi:hypothetical protein